MECSISLLKERDTIAAGEILGAASAMPGAVIFLQGQLGAGKTTFTRGVLRAFDYRGAVKSPTYTLVEPYDFEGGRQVFHFDLYRLGDPEELEYMGVRDYFGNDNLCLIEWPERGEGYLPVADLTVRLAVAAPVAGSVGRQMSITAATMRGERILQEVGEQLCNLD